MAKWVVNPQKFYNQEFKREVDTADIIDYPIAEALKDSEGIPIRDDAMGTYRTTGRTMEFTIKRGQAVELEDYVADILLDRYEFLGVRTSKPRTIPKEDIKSGEEASHKAGVRCPECGQSFRGYIQAGSHIGARHPFLLNVNKPNEPKTE